MRQQLTIEMDDGTTLDVESDARDIRAWEAEYGESWFGKLTFTKTAQLAYLAGRRTGVVNGQWPTYGSFDAHCVDVRARQEAPLIGDPTRPDRTGGSSARSRSGSARSPKTSNGKGRT